MNENQNDFLDYVVFRIYPAVFTTQTATDEYHLHSTDKQKGRPEVLLFEPLFLFYVVVGIKKHLIIDL